MPRVRWRRRKLCRCSGRGWPRRRPSRRCRFPRLLEEHRFRFRQASPRFALRGHPRTGQRAGAGGPRGGSGDGHGAARLDGGADRVHDHRVFRAGAVQRQRGRSGRGGGQCLPGYGIQSEGEPDRVHLQSARGPELPSGAAEPGRRRPTRSTSSSMERESAAPLPSNASSPARACRVSTLGRWRRTRAWTR